MDHHVKNPSPAWRPPRRHGHMRPRRGMKLIALSCLVCLSFIVYAQWKQMTPRPDLVSQRGNPLSKSKLDDDLQACSRLRRKPEDPRGLGRKKNARHVESHKPTLIQNATVWVGEPDQNANGQYSWTQGDIFIEYGLIQQVDPHIDASSLPEGTRLWDAKGRQLTSGVIDMHSHAGVNSLPELGGNEDTNELSGDITPYVRSIDGLNPLDPQIQVIKSGGVTTSLVLPGSGNNIGGEAFVFKHAVGQADGRPEISAEDMLADPDRNWRYMKMACGENPKRVYGKINQGPFSRMGESWEFRHAFEQAANLVRQQDDWCDKAERVGLENVDEYLPRSLEWESLSAVLRGQVHVNAHCYTIPDLEAFVDHTNEFKFPIRAFHHAHQTYLVPEILKKAYGDKPPASALFADNMYYKSEAYIGSEFAGKILWENGLTPVYVSDNPVLNAQHVLFEAAKAYRYGLPYHVALASVTSAPAELLGLGQRIGKVKPGFDADLAVWDSDPLSVGAAPVQVWIDGYAQFGDPVELDKPIQKPSLPPNLTVHETPLEAVQHNNVVFTGISRVLLSSEQEQADANGKINVVVTDGEIVCIGPCVQEMGATGSHETVQLENGYITETFTAFGSLLGLNAIDAESDTDNGPNGDAFSRAVDGLALDTKKLHAAHKYGVTKAISAPNFAGGITRQGTSVGFRTKAENALQKGQVWSEDVAIHYTLTTDAKRGDTPSISAAVGALRRKLIEAISFNDTDPSADLLSEKAFLKRVVDGKFPLVLTIHSADTIASALRLKRDVEIEIANSPHPPHTDSPIRMVILGGAESHLVAPELAKANVGVVLAPLQSYATSWDQRRALTGAPLTNGTAIDVLHDAGVLTAIGLEEDWLVRSLDLLAGIAYTNGGSRLSEKQAVNLVSTNIYKMLGKSVPKETNGRHFLVYEGSPLEIRGRLRAVGSGQNRVTIL